MILSKPTGKVLFASEIKAMLSYDKRIAKVGKTGDKARLIVIFKVASVPIKGGLPLGKALHQAARNKLGFEPFNNNLVALHVLKGEDHVKLLALGGTQVLGLGDVHKDRLAHGERAVGIEHLAAKDIEDIVADIAELVPMVVEDWGDFAAVDEAQAFEVVGGLFVAVHLLVPLFLRDALHPKKGPL